MKEDFLEKIIPIENEEKRLLIKKMCKLLDESIDDFINLRESQAKRSNNFDAQFEELNKSVITTIAGGTNEINNNNNNNNNDNNNNNNDGQIRIDILDRFARLGIRERIRHLEEENEDLDRLIGNDNTEVIG